VAVAGQRCAQQPGDRRGQGDSASGPRCLGWSEFQAVAGLDERPEQWVDLDVSAVVIVDEGIVAMQAGDLTPTGPGPRRKDDPPAGSDSGSLDRSSCRAGCDQTVDQPPVRLLRDLRATGGRSGSGAGRSPAGGQGPARVVLSNHASLELVPRLAESARITCASSATGTRTSAGSRTKSARSGSFPHRDGHHPSRVRRQPGRPSIRVVDPGSQLSESAPRHQRTLEGRNTARRALRAKMHDEGSDSSHRVDAPAGDEPRASQRRRRSMSSCGISTPHLDTCGLLTRHARCCVRRDPAAVNDQRSAWQRPRNRGPLSVAP
jgi:hypothetical protein